MPEVRREDRTVKSLKGSYRITPRPNLVNILAALLLGPMLATGVGWADEGAAPDTWTDQRVETAFHDVLAHGDLSDIGFLVKTFELKLEVLKWEQPSPGERDSFETHAVASAVPSYIHPYNINYRLYRKTKDGATRIDFSFGLKSCPDLSLWGIDWNQQVQKSEGMAMDAVVAFWGESIRWQQDAEGIVLERSTDSNGSCLFTLTQNKRAALSVPKPPATPVGPGTELLEQMIDLVVAADLREYLATAHILHTEMSTYGEIRGHRFYKGGAIPESLIPGTNSRYFRYDANDTGWIDMSILGVYSPPKRGPRTVSLWIPFDTATNCISPESLEAQMRQRHIRFRKEVGQDHTTAYLKTFQRGNDFWIGYDLQGSCIETFRLEQVTDVAHSWR
jgi:hypothetical protein